MPEMTSYRHGVPVWAVLHDPAGAVFAIGQFIALDDPNDWPA